MRVLRPRLWRSTRPRETALQARQHPTAEAPSPESARAEQALGDLPSRLLPGPPSPVPDDSGLAVEESRVGSRYTLALDGELALGSVETFENAIARLWAQPVTAVTLDLRKLSFIDSSGLWTVTRLHKRCGQEHVEFRVIPGPESIQEVFELTGLSDVIPFARAGAPGDAP